MSNASRSQIVATIGPASETSEIISQLIKHQMDVARLNFSHGTHEEHGERIRIIREEAKKAGRSIPILQDLSGPRKNTEEGHGFDKKSETITSKDIKDLEFGINQGVEYVVLSYVGEAADIKRLKEIIKEKGGKQKVIAKIERPEGVENIDSIIEVSDAIMIGRGDLGQAIPIEKVPFAQLDIIKKCNEARKSVITATQMLFSMVENSIPTRAEVTDVAFAILSGSDAVMLSDETTIGKYPVEAVKVMERIVLEAERHIKIDYNLL